MSVCDSSEGGGVACPTCGKPATPAHRPFCSGRCRDVDLGRWLKGTYRIETDETPEDGAGDQGS